MLRENRRKALLLRGQEGFTLIEIIAVLILLGILAAVAIPKYMDMTDEAKNKAVDAGIAELNSRENLLWGKVKLAVTPPTTDAAMDTAIKALADYSVDLGSDYTWPDATHLVFKGGTSVALTRTAATLTAPAVWRRT